MSVNVTAIIIILVVCALVFFLIYTQTQRQKGAFDPYHINETQQPHCEKCEIYKKQLAQISPTPQQVEVLHAFQDGDPYDDPIKKQDLFLMRDPLSFPQQRIPRELLEKYGDYYDKHGGVPFGTPTQPLFDTPIMDGYLSRKVDPTDELGSEGIPRILPLIKMKCAKYPGKYFYYVTVETNSTALGGIIKIPLSEIKVGDKKYSNADVNGIPPLQDGDILEGITIYPKTKFVVNTYKVHHFP